MEVIMVEVLLLVVVIAGSNYFAYKLGYNKGALYTARLFERKLMESVMLHRSKKTLKS